MLYHISSINRYDYLGIRHGTFYHGSLLSNNFAQLLKNIVSFFLVLFVGLYMGEKETFIMGKAFHTHSM